MLLVSPRLIVQALLLIVCKAPFNVNELAPLYPIIDTLHSASKMLKVKTANTGNFFYLFSADIPQ